MLMKFISSHALLETGSAKSELSKGVEIDGKNIITLWCRCIRQ